MYGPSFEGPDGTVGIGDQYMLATAVGSNSMPVGWFDPYDRPFVVQNIGRSEATLTLFPVVDLEKREDG
jgi:hypothetical protein